MYLNSFNFFSYFNLQTLFHFASHYDCIGRPCCFHDFMHAMFITRNLNLNSKFVSVTTLQCYNMLTISIVNMHDDLINPQKRVNFFEIYVYSLIKQALK
jgi:hypothetical protein